MYSLIINNYSIYAQFHVGVALTRRFKVNKEQNEVISSALDFLKSGIKQKKDLDGSIWIKPYGYHGSGAK